MTGLAKRWAAAQDKTRSRKDNVFNRYIMVVVCYGLLIYCVYVYVAEACVPMIRTDGDARGSRAQGIAYLSLFCPLWSILVYTYTLIVFTSPGNAKDYVQSTPCPEPPFPIGGQTAAAPHDPEGASMIGRALERAGPPRHSSEAFAAQLADPSAKLISLPSHEQDLADSQGVAAAFGPAAANAVRVLPSIVPSSQSQISEATAVNTEQGQAPAFGHVPKASMPSATAQSRINPKLVREVPLSGPLHPYLLYCNKCEIVKPPRTHHCRRCGTCVLNMDHHCPWVGGCVGAHNHVYFFAFCFWACITLGYVFVTLLVTLVPPNISPRPSINVQILVITVLAFVLSFFTGSMTVTHWRLIILNQSTIESMAIADMKHLETLRIGKEYKILDLKEKMAVKREFDREWGRIDKEGNLWWLGSKRRNWTTVMGTKVLAWFIPPPKYRPDDGMHYEVNPRRGPDGKWLPRSQWPENLR